MAAHSQEREYVMMNSHASRRANPHHASYPQPGHHHPGWAEAQGPGAYTYSSYDPYGHHGHGRGTVSPERPSYPSQRMVVHDPRSSHLPPSSTGYAMPQRQGHADPMLASPLTKYMVEPQPQPPDIPDMHFPSPMKARVPVYVVGQSRNGGRAHTPPPYASDRGYDPRDTRDPRAMHEHGAHSAHMAMPSHPRAGESMRGYPPHAEPYMVSRGHPMSHGMGLHYTMAPHGQYSFDTLLGLSVRVSPVAAPGMPSAPLHLWLSGKRTGWNRIGPVTLVSNYITVLYYRPSWDGA